MSTTTNAATNPGETQTKRDWAVERRSLRTKALIPVFVYGHGAGSEPFHEDAYAAVVSDNGGLLIMNARVELGRPLLITNRATEEERPCRVAYVGEREPDQSVVAVEFSAPAPGFWRLTKRTETDTSSTEKQNGNG
jgi:hypothetical protein